MASSSNRKGKWEELSRDDVKKVLNLSTKLLCDNLRLDNILLTLQSDEAVKPNDVEKIEQKETDSGKVKALLGILARSPVSSYEAFMRALQEERPDLYKDVKAIEEETSEDTSDLDFECCQQELIDFYMLTMRRVNLLPWYDEDARNMDDIYVTLQLENNGEILDSNENLVTIKMPNGTLAKRILVKGTVGSGKSTLMAKLAYTWAQRNPRSPLYIYDLVFILTFREIEIGCTIIDAIFQQILADNTSVSKVALNKYISSNPNILFLFDGFDEYFAKNLDIVHGEIDAMMNFKTLRKACVIVSSRPHKHLGKCQTLYEPVTLTGFSGENVKNYLSKFFYNNSKLMEGLSRKLSGYGKLESLSHIPVMLMLMCLLWEHSQSLPNKQSKLYEEFTQFLWHKFCHTYNTKSPDDYDSLKHFLISLGKAAFDGLMQKGGIGQEKLMFSEADFLKDLKQGCQVGLLTKERLRSKLTVSNTVTFLHKSFQEYCASYYWASLPDDQFDYALQRIDTIDKIQNKLEILQYLCGIGNIAHVVRTIHHVISVYLAQITKDDSLCIKRFTFGHGPSIKPVLTLLNESDFPSANVQLTKSLESLLSACKELKIDFIVSPWPSFVKTPLAKTLNQVQSIILEPYMNIKSPELLDVISETLTNTTNVVDVRILLAWTEAIMPGDLANRMGKLGECIGTLKQLSTLDIEFCNKCDITTILRPISIHSAFQPQCLKFRCKLAFYSFIECDVDILCHLLANQHQLRTLSLVNIGLYNGTMASVLDAIKAPLCDLTIHGTHIGSTIGHIEHIIPQLHCLKLRDTDLKENDTLTLGKMLPNAKHLSTLDLSGDFGNSNQLGKAVHTLRCIISQLTQLNLEWTGLYVDDIFTLSEFLHEAKCLTYLNLSNNKVGRAAGRLCESLKSCSNLKELDVSYAGITAEDVSALRRNLCNVKKISEYTEEEKLRKL